MRVGLRDAGTVPLTRRVEHIGQVGRIALRAVQRGDSMRNLWIEAAANADRRDDVTPDELAINCLHALAAAGSLPPAAAVRRLVSVILAGLRPRS